MFQVIRLNSVFNLNILLRSIHVFLTQLLNLNLIIKNRKGLFSYFG